MCECCESDLIVYGVWCRRCVAIFYKPIKKVNQIHIRLEGGH